MISTGGVTCRAETKKTAHEIVRGCKLTRSLRTADYFVAILPEPPHFVQLLPALADSTQHAWVQVLPASFALVQQPATFAASLSAANITPNENRDAIARAVMDFENFFIIVLGWLIWCGRRESNPPLMLGKHT